MTDQKGREGRPTGKVLTPEARRALAEAAERRRKLKLQAEGEAKPAKEIGGADGPEPVRYGDWETKGRASDF